MPTEFVAMANFGLEVALSLRGILFADSIKRPSWVGFQTPRALGYAGEAEQHHFCVLGAMMPIPLCEFCGIGSHEARDAMLTPVECSRLWTLQAIPQTHLLDVDVGREKFWRELKIVRGILDFTRALRELLLVRGFGSCEEPAR